MKLINKRLATASKLLSPFWWLLGLYLYASHNSKKNKLPIKSILIFDFHLIGDIVLLQPFLAAIRSYYPQARIVLVAGPWSRDIVCDNLVDEIIFFSAPWVIKTGFFKGLMNCLGLILRLKKIDWDLGIEMRGDVRQILLLSLSGPTRRVGFAFTGGKQLLSDIVPDDGSYAHLANHHQRIAEFLGIWPVGRKYLPQLILKDSEIREAEKIPPYVGFHFGASLPLRRLPDRESLVLLTHWLKKDVPVVLFVPPGDADRLNQLISGLPVELLRNLTLWSGSLRSFVVMLSRAERLFLMDSGPAHIAAALGVRSTVIFGSNKSELIRPIGNNVEIVEKSNVPCRPCNQIVCHHQQSLFCMKGLVINKEVIGENLYFEDP